MILKNIRYLITQNAERQILEDVDVLIEGDEIAGIGRGFDARGQDVIDCSNKVVLPGLVNAHTHVPMSVFRGISDNKLLENWLEEDIFPAEEKLDGDDVYYGSLLGIAEMLKTGTTTFNEMYGYVDQITKAVEKTGMRAVISRGVLDIDGEGRERIEESLNFVRRYQDHDLIIPGFAPHAVYTTSERTLKELNDYSEIFDTLYHTHVSETEKENMDCLEEKGRTPVKYMDDLGVIDEDFVAAHGVWLTEDDMDILAERKASVVYNPGANMKLGSGVADVPGLIEKNINIAIGTDGSASNNNLNLFEEAKIGVLIHKRNDPRVLTEQDMLDMLTINGAKALGLQNEIGSICVGKKADIICIDLNNISMSPIYGKKGLISNIVYSFSGGVSETIVDGRLLVKNGGLIRMNESEIIREVQERIQKFR